jgi:diguanylate cyclase (GGDEF)-like protein
MELEEFLSLAACKLEPLVPHRSLVVYRIDEGDGLLRACFATGRSADRLRLTTIPLGERLSGWTALQRRAHRGLDHRSPLHRDGFRSDLEDWADDEDVRELGSAVAAPLIAGDRCVGVLTLYDREERRFLGSERAVLVRIASRLAGAFDRASPTAPIDASLTDPLTGVPNARFLWLETAYRIGQRTASPTGFGLLAFRLLGIERVTEQYGNDTTDDLVGRVARRFATACDEGETLVRFGPDLFVILSAVDEPGELTRRWHALALDVEQPIRLLANRPVHQVRLSAAHAVFPDDGECLDSLLAALDERLALSTGAGRTVVPFRATAERGQTPA